MCGIVGYYGKQDQVLDTLVSGLKRLEYRGYDSAGVAIINKDQEFTCIKEVGKIKNLENKINNQNIPEFKGIGIAHTRWATHGVPSVENAHPHSGQDQKIFLVHNGIIENYQEIKDKLTNEGVTFYSQTDTEVLAKLIEFNYTGDLKEAVLKSLEVVQGAYATVVLAKNEPDRLIAVKKGSPMVLGLNGDEYILGSDVSAIISKTREVIYLEDGEMIDINNGQYSVCNLDNQSLDKDIHNIDWDEDAASKEGYEHFLIKEILEQPKVIKDSVRGRLLPDTGDIKFGGLIDVMDKIKEVNRVIILGIGTSFYSAKLGELYFESIANIPAKAEMSPEFRYNDAVIDDKTWVIAISQSGETADTIAGIEEAKRKGALVTGIVNSVGSTIARITDAGVYNQIGPEISVASTKAFTSQATLLLMHAILLGRTRGLGYTQAEELISEIKKLPEYFEKVALLRGETKELASKYINYDNLVYVGRKYNYPIALEGALKIKEVSYVHAEGLSAGEFKHGFIALIDEKMPTIAILTKDSVYDKMVSNVEEIRARNGKIIAIASEGDERVESISEDVIYVPRSTKEEIQPLINNMALQLLAYNFAHGRGLDVDKPRNLAKSVTVE